MRTSFYVFTLLLLSLAACSPSQSDTGNQGDPSVEPHSDQATPLHEIPDTEAEEHPLRNFDLLTENAKSGGQPEGLLVGFYTDSTYFSRYFLIENGKVVEQLDLPYLATPQPDGFHYIQEMVTRDEMDREAEFDEEYPHIYFYRYRGPRDFSSADDLLSAVETANDHPVEHPEIDSQNETLDFYDEQGTRCIRYILPGLVNLLYYGDGYGGGVHGYYWWDEYTTTFSLMNATANEGRKSQDSLLNGQYNAEEWEEIKRQLYIRGPKGDEYYSSGPDDNPDLEARKDDQIGDYDSEYEVDVEKLDFNLARVDDKLMLTAMAYAPAPYVYAHTYEVAIGYTTGPLGPPFITQPAFPVPLDSIQDMGETLLLSPNQNSLFLVDGSGLTGWDVATQAELTSDLFNTGENLIMVEWAVGEHAKRWLKELRP